MTRSKANKLEFITSFTTEKKGEKIGDEKDEFDKLNFSPVSNLIMHGIGNVQNLS